MNRSPLINKLVEAIKVNYKPQKIILFGSHAWGNPTDESDIDLLIVKDTDKPFHKRWAEVCRLVSDLRKGIAFSPFVVTPDELRRRLELGDQFFEEIIRKGSVLYAG